MENFSITKPDGKKVSCVKEIPESAKTVVVAVHGFTSSKESSTVQLLLKRLPAAGFGVVGIDLPGHGTGESLKETLRIPAAVDSIEAAEKYCLDLNPDYEICYFASSFGAYLTAIYISTRKHKGRKAFFRSAAVNMPKLFIKENPTETEEKWLDDLEKLGYFDATLDFGAPVRINRAMFDDLQSSDLFSLFDPVRFGEHKIAMAHGEKDELIDPEEARHFAEIFRIPAAFFPGEGHSLSNSPETPDAVIDLAVSLYKS